MRHVYLFICRTYAHTHAFTHTQRTHAHAHTLIHNTQYTTHTHTQIESKSTSFVSSHAGALVSVCVCVCVVSLGQLQEPEIKSTYFVCCVYACKCVCLGQLQVPAMQSYTCLKLCVCHIGAPESHTVCVCACACA
jgi:hypothetical protein